MKAIKDIVGYSPRGYLYDEYRKIAERKAYKKGINLEWPLSRPLLSDFVPNRRYNKAGKDFYAKSEMIEALIKRNLDEERVWYEAPSPLPNFHWFLIKCDNPHSVMIAGGYTAYRIVAHNSGTL